MRAHTTIQSWSVQEPFPPVPVHVPLITLPRMVPIHVWLHELYPLWGLQSRRNVTRSPLMLPRSVSIPA